MTGLVDSNPHPNMFAKKSKNSRYCNVKASLNPLAEGSRDRRIPQRISPNSSRVTMLFAANTK